MAVNIKHMRTIKVSQETYDRLQQRAVPFEDTPESVIVDLLDESRAREHRSNQQEEGGLGTVTTAPPKSAPHFGEGAQVDVVVDDPLNPPSLKHTKVLRAAVNGRDVDRANWTKVRQAVVALAFQRGYDLWRLLEVCPLNAVETPKTDDGYTHYADLGVSIQGQDANHAWQATVALARALGVRVEVWFQWRTKPDAKYPGKRGLLSVG